MKYLYVAHYDANNDTEEFETFKEAKNYLEEQYSVDSCEGFSEESCEGGDYIAKITHKSIFIETQNKEKDGYKWDEERCGYFDADGDEWISEDDNLGEIQLREL